MTTTVKLAGLTCSACQKVIEKRLSKISGVSSVIVSLEDGKTDVTADRNITTEEIKNALEGTKYVIL